MNKPYRVRGTWRGKRRTLAKFTTLEQAKAYRPRWWLWTGAAHRRRIEHNENGQWVEVTKP